MNEQIAEPKPDVDSAGSDLQMFHNLPRSLSPASDRDSEKFIQYYEDGMKKEFTGPVGSRYPSPVVTLKKIETSTK
ncbi:MAG TPA: hypothetical protein VNV82_06925 [Bryobacteraceae bacterium]|jgi:hypothetical protein|nr:hypothetical protein [Bryobacteraceae bacterium]